MGIKEKIYPLTLLYITIYHLKKPYFIIVLYKEVQKFNSPHIKNVSFLPFHHALPIISIIDIDIAATATGQKQAGACGCPDFYIYISHDRRRPEERGGRT